MGIIVSLFLLFSLVSSAVACAVDYDIVYVRAPRYGDTTTTHWPEVNDPIDLEPGSDLMLLHPNGTEEVLVDAGDNGAVVDPNVSFDGEWVYYSFCPDAVTDYLGNRPILQNGCDIYKINASTRQVMQLTHGEFTPNTGVTTWCTDIINGGVDCTYPKHGVFNLGAAPLPGGKIVFTSNRNGFLPNKTGSTLPNLQLFVLDEATGIVDMTGHLNLGSAMHPVPLMDGRVMFSSLESQGLRDDRLWGIWHIWPDGSRWGPLMSAMTRALSQHWHAQLSDGSLATVAYYNGTNFGFGTLVRWDPADVPPGQPAFGSPSENLNAPIAWGCGNDLVPGTTTRKIAFSPIGLESLTEFVHGKDLKSCIDQSTGLHMGKVVMPSGAPGNDLLLVWSPGPVNESHTPFVDGGIYILEDGVPISHPNQLTLIKNDPNYNEQQPKALVPYSDIYGIDEPNTLPWLPTDSRLEAGEPFGMVGTSSVIWRDTDAANNSNWVWQGANAGSYTDADIYAIRIVAQEPTSHLRFGLNSFGVDRQKWYDNLPDQSSHHNERMRILGEFPVRHFDAEQQPILDDNGNQDTSFLVKVPADTSFTFQTLDNEGMVLNMSQTWHTVRSGEVRNDCGGCHAHSKVPLPFAGTVASQPSYPVQDLATMTPLLQPNGAMQTQSVGAIDVEYNRDIVPILATTTFSAHTYTQLAGLFDAFQSRISSLIASLRTEVSAADLMTVARWIDLGAPIDKDANLGWFLDELRPTVHIKKLTDGRVRIGAFDYYSGLNASTLLVKADGVDVTADLIQVNPSLWEICSCGGTPVNLVEVSVADNQGNIMVQKASLASQ